MASTLVEELKTVATEVVRSQTEDAVWAALAAGEGPRGKGIDTLLVDGIEGEERGWYRTTRTMGRFVSNSVRTGG